MRVVAQGVELLPAEVIGAALHVADAQRAASARTDSRKGMSLK